MRIPRIFTDQIITVGNQIKLSAVASHHIIHVLRITTGRQIILFNGQGGEYSGVVASTTKKIASIEITEFQDVDRESPLSVELAICLIKNDRMDWLLQKATELGVSNISLLVSERTHYKIKADRTAKKLQHWQQIVISACEQSGRTAVPTIQVPKAFDAWLATAAADERYILHPGSHQKSHKSYHDSPSSLALLIGPEGGFTDIEFNLAMDNQFSPLTLGPRILRAETAPLVALAIVQRQFGDFYTL